jgi:hypothetical protein
MCSVGQNRTWDFHTPTVYTPYMTVPLYGFRGVSDYFRDQSSVRVLHMPYVQGETGGLRELWRCYSGVCVYVCVTVHCAAFAFAVSHNLRFDSDHPQSTKTHMHTRTRVCAHVLCRDCICGVTQLTFRC